jgi:peptidylprolyl isomerase/peptidyl-prolyl cis-trans isomerase A (cyclophilin A)
MIRPTLLVLAALALTHAPAALAEGTPDAKAKAAKADPKALYAVFETSRGKIGVQLLPGEAPKTVANFVELATAKKEFKDPITGQQRKAAYYDGTLFHRVIPGFMIQGGDPTTRGAALGADKGPSGVPFGIYGPGYKFEDELPAPGKRLFDRPCALAMANSGPNTNGSQFFITEGFGPAVPQLEPRPCGSPSGVCGYTRFGTGVCGCDLVGQIARAGNSQTRLVKVTIQSAPPTCK